MFLINRPPGTAKWISFGWHVQRVDGHDFEEMDGAVLNAKAEKGKPSMIVLDTIKAKGVAGAEDEVTSHHMMIDYETAKEKIAQLGE